MNDDKNEVYINDGKGNLGEGNYDSISYYQGLLLMELSNISNKQFKAKSKKRSTRKNAVFRYTTRS